MGPREERGDDLYFCSSFFLYSFHFLLHLTEQIPDSFFLQRHPSGDQKVKGNNIPLFETYPVEEVVIIDVGSIDKTTEIASSYPVRIVRQINKGLAVARNTAIKNINTEFIASVDADCLPEPDWLKHLMKRFNSSKIAGSGGILLETYSSTVFDLWRSVHMKQRWEGTAVSFLFGSNTVFRKKALVKTGLYNERLKNNYEDVEICKHLKKKGYNLIYEPKAIVDHLKFDDIYSILNTYWRWNIDFYKKKKYYANQKSLNFKIEDNMGLAYRYIEEDIASRNYQLLYLDFLLTLHHSLRDFEYFIHQDDHKYSNYPGPLSFWLSLLDLNFFYHIDASRRNLSTLIKKSDIFLQNFFALGLVLSECIEQNFRSDAFNRILYKHLLLSIYKIKDDYLLERLLNLINLNKGWKELLKKKQPNLNHEFLEVFYFAFQKLLKELILRFPKIIQMIEISADKIDKISYF